jgi:hypothetical protein
MMSQPAPERDASHVLTLEEISKLASEGGKPAETLMNVVALIATRFQTDVCSAYLLEPDRANLVLAATVGLRPQCIGTLRLGLHEGLTGLVAELLGKDAGERVVRDCALSVAGQCCFYRHAHEMISRLYPEHTQSPVEIEHLADHITRFSLAAIAAYPGRTPT